MRHVPPNDCATGDMRWGRRSGRGGWGWWTVVDRSPAEKTVYPEVVSVDRTLLPALIAGMAALVGSWLGAAFALQRFKRERAFERRLQWYHDAHDALLDFGELVEEVRALVREHGWDRRAQERWRSDVLPGVVRIGKLLDAGYMYATRVTLRTMVTAFESADEAGAPWIDGAEVRENEAFFNALEQQLETVHNALQEDAREMLFPDWRPRWLRPSIPRLGHRSGKVPH